MNIPYRTQRVLNRLGVAALVLLIVGTVAWVCWVMWLQRYIVYTDEGATLDFSQSANDIVGEVAVPPVAEANVSIFYNEGANAIDTTNELKQLFGYYITNDMVKNDLDNVLLQVERLSADTAVMIEMKGPYGSFFYNTSLSGATVSQSMEFWTQECEQRAVPSQQNRPVGGRGAYVLAGSHQVHHDDLDFPGGHGAEKHGLQRGHAGGFPLPQLQRVSV